jgi:hypothetical protein
LSSGNLSRSGVLVLVSWAHRISVSYIGSPIFGPLLVLAILPGFVDELVMSFWNFELFPVNRILVFEMNPVFVISGQT